MSGASGRPEIPVTGEVPVSWLVRQRRTACLQLEALSPRGSRHHAARAVALRRRVRLLDAAIARSVAAAR
ncbi:MAG: hypothetical protein U0S36_06485 [Candidatus Nanopelagicales bacterium]|jgi:hypothetical protein